MKNRVAENRRSDVANSILTILTDFDEKLNYGLNLSAYVASVGSLL